MGRRWHCHDRRAVSLLADHIRNIGAAKPNAKTLCTGSVLKCGVWVTLETGMRVYPRSRWVARSNGFCGITKINDRRGIYV